MEIIMETLHGYEFEQTPKLIDTIKAPLKEFHVERIERIDNEDFMGVKGKVKRDFLKAGIDVSEEYIEEGILALKQYYAVALLDPKNKHAVSDMVDPFWHAHILHTADYMKFCDETYGQYVPHEPLDPDNQDEVAEVASLYAYTSRVYDELFSGTNEVLFPKELPDARLMCTHSEIYNEEVRLASVL
jgi:hypothetical protein